MKHFHNIAMFFIMILSGLLSTMNMWVDKYDDIRFGMNTIYMILLMTGWMFFFMGIFYKEFDTFIIGLIFVILNIWCIRTQFLITENQYKLDMIPHHSMAIFMSKKLLEKNNNMSPFLANLINTQEKEIIFMKKISPKTKKIENFF
jgi:hypothetical protein